jgi:SM-20-related protein
MLNTSIDKNALYDQIADEIANKGYCVLKHFLSDDINQALTAKVTQLNADELQQAGIGRNTDYLIEKNIRNDKTRWLDSSDNIDSLFLNEMAELRLAMNQRLFLGLFDYECHYAHYAPGAFYQKHVDAFKGKSSRLLTTVTYFNNDWQDNDGGEILLYHPDTDEVIESVKPEMGTFVIFLSDQFPHEVLKASRDRYSIAGWFRVPDPLQAPIL